ncbi:MAG: diguanylate cyclase domain-containing protein [Actinomycetales bacterium]
MEGTPAVYSPRERPLRDVAPFLTVAAVGMCSLLVSPGSPITQDQVFAVLGALVGLIVVAALVVLIPRSSTVAVLPWLVFLLVVQVVRGQTGGSLSGVAPLALLPMLWQVLYGTRVQLLTVATGAGVLFIAPVLWAGPQFATSDWRRGVLYLLIGVLLCPPLQSAVARLRESRTEQATLAARLAVAQDRWRTLLEHLPGTSVHVVGVDGTPIVAVGQAITGVDPAGRGLVEAMSEEFGARFLQACAWAGEGESTHTEGEIHTPQGPRHLALDVEPLPGEGLAREVLVVARDVTGERERERDLIQARDRFERIFSDAPHGQLLVATDATLSRVNARAAHMLGRDLSSLVGLPVSELDLPELEESVREVLAGFSERVAADQGIEGEEVVVGWSVVGLQTSVGTREVLVTMVDVTERVRVHRTLSSLADRDPLTNLANRRRFGADVDACLSAPLQIGAVLLLDLDNFKRVNDTHGHAAGDALLIEVAHALDRRFRSADTVARLGGDEFAVLMPGAKPGAVAHVAEDIVTLIASIGAPHGVTASVGAAIIEPGMTPESLMVAADRAMYRAKKSGRNRYHVGHRTTPAEATDPAQDGHPE